MSIKYIDIHTHRRIDANDVVSILSVDVHHAYGTALPEHCSIGVHPWHLEAIDVEAALDKVQRNAGLKQVVAIGECGIDRMRKLPLSLQKDVFLQHVHIAENVGKPVIIHAVRAYSDLLALRKHSDRSLPWIVHGFNGAYDIAMRLIEKNIRLSFGPAILDAVTKASRVMHALPRDFLFIETDETPELLQDMYTRASVLLDVEASEFAQLMLRNYQSIMHDHV